jgi:hypothetical protein
LAGAAGKFPITPSEKIKRWIQLRGGYIDPETNKWVFGRAPFGAAQASHLYPSSRIKQLPGFDRLTAAQQNWLLNHPDNFIPLPRQWNASMGNKLADDWAKTTTRGKMASKEFIDQLRESQEAFEGFAKEMIKFWLSE